MLLVAVLTSLLASPDYATRDAATAALASLATPADLAPLLDSPDPEVRMRASLLLDELEGAPLRRWLASWQSLPYIDADPQWQAKGWQVYLGRAMRWHRDHGRPDGMDADWSSYKLATLLAIEDGALWYDPLAWPVLLRRTECYRACRRWE